MPEAIFNEVALGDLRPVEVTISAARGDVAAPLATVASATYKIERFRDGPGVIFAAGPCVVVPVINKSLVVTGYRVSTSTFILFATRDTYTVKYSIVWSDGQITNTVSAAVLVGQSACNQEL